MTIKIEYWNVFGQRNYAGPEAFPEEEIALDYICSGTRKVALTVSPAFLDKQNDRNEESRILPLTDSTALAKTRPTKA